MVFRWRAALRRRNDDGAAPGAPSACDAGFSLLEVIVSFTIFAIVSGGATYGIVNALDAAHSSQQRVDAANVAQSYIASAGTNPLMTQRESGRTFTTSLAGEQFTVKRWVTYANARATQCSPGSTFTVNVLVWQAQTGNFLARSDAVIAC